MTKKKDQKISVSQADEAQARSVLGQFHQIAKELHSSTDQKEAETALTAITSMPETAQMALVKALSRERDTDAADVLTAINELSPGKNVRKEARRSLIRLEQEKIYPQWEAPIDRTPVLALQDIQASSNPPRFWKGVVTNSRDVGEAQLMLFWEQGDNYKDVRVLGFLLEFWHDGVKDFFTTVESKRNIDKLVAEMQSQVETLDCSLAKGRRLIQEALEANKKHGTTPHKDYRLHASLVKQLVLDAPVIEDEDEDEDDIEDEEDIGTSIIDPDMEPTQVVTRFMDAWVDGDFDLAYKLNAAMNGSMRPIRSDSSQTSCMNAKHRKQVSGCPIRLAGGAQPLTKWLRSAGQSNSTIYLKILHFPHCPRCRRQLSLTKRPAVTGSGQVTRSSRKRVVGAFKA